MSDQNISNFMNGLMNNQAFFNGGGDEQPDNNNALVNDVIEFQKTLGFPLSLQTALAKFRGRKAGVAF